MSTFNLQGLAAIRAVSAATTSTALDAAIGADESAVLGLTDDLDRLLGLTREKQAAGLMRLAIKSPLEYLEAETKAREEIYAKIKVVFREAYLASYGQLGKNKADSIKDATSSASSLKKQLLGRHKEMFRYGTMAEKVLKERGE